MKSKILNKEFDFQCIHVALLVDDNLWQHDKWLVIINEQTFDYHTGIGNRISKGRYYEKEFRRLINIKPKQNKENLIKHCQKLEQVSKVKPPKMDDNLYSLLVDADAINYSFNDWCDTFGYDTDSIKAQNIYNDCQKNGKKIASFIGNLDEAREKFKDY